MNDNWPHRRPRRTFPPEIARAIRRENAAMALGTVAFWALAIGWFGRMLRWW